MIPAALVALALVDGALLGFRAAAGRNGRVDKRSYFRRAVLRGAGLAALVALGGVALAFTLVALRGAALYADLVRAARSGVVVFTLFAALVLSALTAWIIPHRDLRTLLTVTILGPGTLARPYVVLAGLAATVITVPRWEVVLLGAYGATTMLALERLVTRRYYPVDAQLFEP